MEYQALYRKYRPHSFADFIDQDNVKKILINSILNNKISHAYLFSGPRGIGKTSMAKIFAKAINCQNFAKNNDVCEECDNCVNCNEQSVDIVEIDAASNNGVDQIRELKSKISVVPSKLKYKVYIVDEVHMLSNSAFNALLKTLEEPPKHAVFILATTEFYEVPETIVSRCQCFAFSRISVKSLENRLKYIVNNEKIEIEDDVITAIANYSNGGLRDAIGMLDKLNSFTNEKITMDVFNNLNGIVSYNDIESFYKDVFDGNIDNILKMINKIDWQGYEFKKFIEYEMIYVRDKIVDYYQKNTEIKGNITQNINFVENLNTLLNELKESLNPIVITQVEILKFCENMNNISREIKTEDDKNISREIISEGKKNVENKNLIENTLSNESVRNDEKTEKKCKNDQISGKIHVNLQIKAIRINNSMATANKTLKENLNKKWNDLSRFFMDERYSRVAQLLSDTIPMVVGDNYMILTTKSDGIINNIYANFLLSEELIAKFYKKIAFVVVNEDEFEQIKEKYVNDRKNNIVYHLQEECGKLLDEENDLINQAVNFFGSDIVEIE